jgi:hypothetical protein
MAFGNARRSVVPPPANERDTMSPEVPGTGDLLMRVTHFFKRFM